MRSGFWRGVIAGSIIGAAVSMMAGGKMVSQKKGFIGQRTRRSSARARRIIKDMSKTVNHLIK